MTDVEKMSEARSRPPGNPQSGSPKIRILVVDDEPSVTRTISRLLTKQGYEVIEVNDSTKVEQYLLYSKYGLAITDYRMPGLDGLKILKLIKESNPDLPVLFLTGHGTIDTAVEATKGGAVVFLTKPFEPEDLIQAVKNHARVDQALTDDILNSIEHAGLNEADQVVTPDRIVLKDEIVSTATIPDGLVEVKFEEILPGQILPFSLYIQIYNKTSGRHMLRKICEANTVFTTGLKNILEKRGLGSAFIKEQEYGSYLEYYTAVKSSAQFQIHAVRDKKRLLLYGKAVEAVTDILSDPIGNRNIQSALELVDNMFQTIVNDPVTYMDMFRLFQKDTSIFNHSANVCLLCVSFCVYMGLDGKYVQELGMGALFHDVGMNRLDKRVLEKKGPLTKSEWDEIKKHPERGVAILRNSKEVPIRSLKVILEHHETLDGSGYPRGISGTQIGKLTNICRIIDKFDSMTTKKPYREAFTAAEALKRLFIEESHPSMQNLIRKFTSFLGGK